MVYVLPTTFTVRKQIKFRDVTYTAGQTIPGDLVAQMRNSDSLLSMKYIVPTPDPHSRKTKSSTPTPVSLPATVRQKLTTAVEPHTLDVEPQSATAQTPTKKATKKESEK